MYMYFTMFILYFACRWCIDQLMLYITRYYHTSINCSPIGTILLHHVIKVKVIWSHLFYSHSPLGQDDNDFITVYLFLYILFVSCLFSLQSKSLNYIRIQTHYVKTMKLNCSLYHLLCNLVWKKNHYLYNWPVN